MRRGLRFRLAATLVVLVALTAALLGVGASVAVESLLRDRLQDEAAREANFDLSVLVPSVVPPGAERSAFASSGLEQTLRLRGGIGTIVDWGDADPFVSQPQLAGALAAIPDGVRRNAAAGQLAYAWLPVAGVPSLVVGARPAGYAATFWFVRDVSDIENALATLRLALLGVGVVLVLVAIIAARQIARGILRPVDSSARAAERIAGGDLTARVPSAGGDELGAMSASFNRMAAALQETVERLREAESQNRRFVADVSHELRTPVAALVAEASLVRDALATGELGAAERRAAELLVADVARLRTLVEDLMELSRFDASAEQPRRERVDLGRLVGRIAATRAPEASVVLPTAPLIVETEARRLDRIIGNVIDNAREHAPGSPIEVQIAGDGGGAVVSIRDHGPGVDPADLPHLFERFWKADRARTRGAGASTGTSGLGLAIAAEHAGLLGATLSASLPPDGGLLVTLRLPLQPRRSIAERGDGGRDGSAPASSVAEPLPSGDGTVIDGEQPRASSEPAAPRSIP